MAELWAVLGIGLALLSAPGSFELLLLTVGGVLPPRRITPKRQVSHAPLDLAIVVPAHNEADGIASCIASLRACDPGDGTVTVVVVADNCEDDTAAQAAATGARVLVRHDPARRGKGYALDFAFRQLLTEPFAAFLVVDADTRVEPNLCAEAQRGFQAGAAGKGRDRDRHRRRVDPAERPRRGRRHQDRHQQQRGRRGLDLQEDEDAAFEIRTPFGPEMGVA